MLWLHFAAYYSRQHFTFYSNYKMEPLGWNASLSRVVFSQLKSHFELTERLPCIFVQLHHLSLLAVLILFTVRLTKRGRNFNDLKIKAVSPLDPDLIHINLTPQSSPRKLDRN